MRILRALTLNLWGAEEPLAPRIALLKESLRALAPDLVALQEVREIPGQLPNQAEDLAKSLGYGFVFEPAVAFGGGHEGLAVLSRHPIGGHMAIELPHAQPAERRILLSARIDTDAGSLWVNTTHLNYRLQHGRQREDQVRAVDAALVRRGSGVVQLLMGDFNARPDSDEIRYLCGQHTLENKRAVYQDAWACLHPGQPQGFTWASANTYARRLRFLGLDRRLDYIFVTPERRDGAGTIHSCEIVLDRPNEAGVFASDHFGLLAEVQIDASVS
jgi:endonuclease/exonuclease/phosphatase family metal-dependent hydrolase